MTTIRTRIGEHVTLLRSSGRLRPTAFVVAEISRHGMYQLEWPDGGRTWHAEWELLRVNDDERDQPPRSIAADALTRTGVWYGERRDV